MIIVEDAGETVRLGNEENWTRLREKFMVDEMYQ
jgi:hypothetical protein